MIKYNVFVNESNFRDKRIDEIYHVNNCDDCDDIIGEFKRLGIITLGQTKESIYFDIKLPII